MSSEKTKCNKCERDQSKDNSRIFCDGKCVRCYEKANKNKQTNKRE